MATSKKIDPRDGPDDWEAPQRLVARHASDHDGCCEEYRLNAPAKKCGNCPRNEECDCLKVVDTGDELHQILAEALALTGG